MIKKILSYLLLYGVLFTIFAVIATINDAKTNGFFTSQKQYTVTPSINQKISQIQIHSDSPYLGIISLQLEVSREGAFTFRLKQLGSDTWYYQQHYETEKIEGYSPYPFGFPPIIDSADKDYIVQIESDNDSLVRFHSSEKQTIVTSKHTIPKNYLFKNPRELERFVFDKSTTIFFSNLNFFTYSLIIYGLLIGIFYNDNNKSKKSFSTSLFAIPDKKYSVKGLVFLLLALSLFFYGNSYSMQGGAFILIEMCVWSLAVIYNRFSLSIFYLLSLFALTISLVCLLIGQPSYAESVSVWVWLFLLLGFFSHVMSSVNLQMIGKRLIQYGRINKHYLLYASFLTFVLVTVILSVKVRLYFLGGDDSKLYYLYPQEFYANFVSKLGPDAAPSSLVSLLPPSSIAPFVILLSLVKVIFPIVNLQALFFLANILGGIFFFYLLIGQLVEEKKERQWIVIKGIGSIMYVFSIFNFYTLLNSLLIAQYLISAFPLTMYFYLRGIREKKMPFIVCSGLIISLFCFFSASLPWFAAAVLVFIPYVIPIFLQNKIAFLKYTAILGFLVILLNSYWMLQLSNSSVIHTNSQTKSSLVSKSFRSETEEGIKASALHNKIFYPLLNTYFYDIQKDFQWSQLAIFDGWYRYIIIFNIIFPITVVAAGFFVDKNSRLGSIYYVSLISLLLALYFLTVNITSWTLRVFLWLTLHIPGFVMFRNMFDKFPYALSLCYALSISISLMILVGRMRNKRITQILLTTIFVVIVINALPYIRGDFLNLPIWTTAKSYNRLYTLNQDYLDLISYAKTNPNASRYVWFPLAHGNIAQIQDNTYDEDYYHGISPFSMLSGKNDFSGELSFENFGKDLINDIMTAHYSRVGSALQKFNARYVIVNKSVTNDFQYSYIYSDGLYAAQNTAYKTEILGKKIKDFGTRYSLYEINQKYMSDKFYVTNNLSVIPEHKVGEIEYEKKSSNEYQVKLTHIPKDFYLVFLDPYFYGWSIYTQDNKISLFSGEHLQPFSYANAWKLNVADLVNTIPSSNYSRNADGTYNLSLSLLFVSPQIFKYAEIVSLASYVFSFSYVFYYVFNKGLKSFTTP